MNIINKLLEFKQWIIHIVSHRNLDDKRGYEVRMCANCGTEEEMHPMERWCYRCRIRNSPI
jgi:hypothetical protein